MKKLVALSISALVLTACSGDTPTATGNAEGQSSSKNAEIAALQTEIGELRAKIYGAQTGDCGEANVLGDLAAYEDSMKDLPDAALESELWHKAMGEVDGVMTVPSGLQYRVIRPGVTNGAKPNPTDKVTVNYHGTFTDGKMFDSSYNRGTPSEFQANGVISGWVEALADMSACEARTLYIPGKLAYGPSGRGPSIPPNATLIFNVQMLSIKQEGLVDENRKLNEKISQLEQYSVAIAKQLNQLAAKVAD